MRNQANKKAGNGLRGLGQIVLTLLFLTCSGSAARAQVVINEAMASTAATLRDLCGRYEDWVELYNNGGSAVDLTNYKLQDNGNTWNFPAAAIQPGGYLIVWANDGACPAEPLSATLKLNASGETVTLRDPLYLQIDAVTYPTATPDESYGRYPNGTGAFERMSSPTPGGSNVSTILPSNPDARYIKINEAVTSNNTGIQDEDGDNSDWIEFKNIHPTKTINMAGLRIADTSKQWVFPDVAIGPGQYLLVWASDKNRTSPQLHANFALSSGGETLTFYNTDGSTIEDQIVISAIIPDDSYGRIPDGTGSFKELDVPTPLEANVDVPITNNPNHVNITINEVSSNNISGYRDSFGNYEDWIELKNKGAVAVDLEGLRIADEGRVWACPGGKTLNAGEYVVIIASGRNITTGDEWHTNFNISSTFGETLQLLHKDGTGIETDVIDQLAEDVSFGRDPDGTGNFRVFQVPTPGAENENITISPNEDADLIVFNEFVSKNNTGLQDEDGDFEDWIELFNTSTTTSVNLEGLKLKDSLKTWVFPAVTMTPRSYLIVFASDKNRLEGQLHTNFAISDAGETLTFVNLDNSVISTVNIPALLPDQSYGRDPDGVGNFRIFNIPTPGSENKDNVVEPNPDGRFLRLNEFNPDNEMGLLDEDATFQDWIELTNRGLRTVDLTGFRLRDNNSVWVFPAGQLSYPQERLIVFASGKNRRIKDQELHTNFVLESSGGEQVSLLNTDGTVVQQVLLPAVGSDHSFGLFPDGEGLNRIFTTPTPSEKNILFEAMELEADYILSTQAANGVFNDIVGTPATRVGPLNNALSIMALVQASESLNDPLYMTRAGNAATYLLNVQDTDGAWYDQYDRITPTILSKSTVQTAAVMIAFERLGYQLSRYQAMIDAADFLMDCQNPANKQGNDDGLVGHGKNIVGAYNTDRWVLDNAYAYQAFLAAEKWAQTKGDNTLAARYKGAAQDLLDGINTALYTPSSAPVWHAVINKVGVPQCNPEVPAAYCTASTHMSYAPRLLDVPATGVDNSQIGDWIEAEFQDASKAIVGFTDNGDGQLATREYPRLGFQSTLAWMDERSNMRVNNTLVWTDTTALKNNTNGGWIDWREQLPDAGETPAATERLISTSAFAILTYDSGYNFLVESPLRPRPIELFKR